MGVLLTDPKASPRAVRLYEMLNREFGQRIMLAQQESPMRDQHEQEMIYIRHHTGRLPLIRGLDFIHNDFDGVTERALRWNERSGVVSICWHTGVEGIGYPESRAEKPDFDLLLCPGTPQNDLLLRRWDAAIRALDRLQKADVPVLWRPFHEFDGKWFWWGKGGGEGFIRLWQTMYRCFVREHGLHHLIWTLGYADDVNSGWYPGNEYCDILGSDTYKGITTHSLSFQCLRKLNAQKPLAFHECGAIPDVESFYLDHAVWAWLMPWHGRWLTENNPPAHLNQVYHDPRVITLGDVQF